MSHITLAPQIALSLTLVQPGMGDLKLHTSPDGVVLSLTPVLLGAQGSPGLPGDVTMGQFHWSSINW